MRHFAAAVAGIVVGLAATALGALIYALSAFTLIGPSDVLALLAIALSGWCTILPCGALLGVVFPYVRERKRALSGVTIYVALAASAGCAVGYSFTLDAPHVSPTHAIVAVGLAWLGTAFSALLATHTIQTLRHIHGL